MTIFLEWAKARVNRGFAPIILVVGKQRMGKTCTALKLAYELDKNYDPDKQMFFEVVTFAKAVNQYKGKVLILDEAGIELDTYRYSDVRQRCFSHVVQTQAYKGNTLFLVLPHSSDLARCHRKYVDALLVISGRGSYIMYRPSIQYYNMNDIDIFTKKIEWVIDIPLPPNHIFSKYKSKYETQIKQGILDMELEKLDTMLNKGNIKKDVCPRI